MEHNFLQDVFNIGFNLVGLYKSKNIVKRIQAFLIYIAAIRNIKIILNKVSPYYEWYHNIIVFMNRTLYESDYISSVNVFSTEQFEISQCIMHIEEQIYHIKIVIPFDNNKKPSMNINIETSDHDFRHYVLDNNDIVYYLNHNDSYRSDCLIKMIEIFNKELYKSCQNFLSGKWINNVN